MPETRNAFHQQLDEIKRDLIRVSARVIDMIVRGTRALLDVDLATAQELIDADDDIDSMTLDIEERCFSILALQQPVASDLRAIVTAIRLTSELERSADLMVNVSKGARRLYGRELPGSLRSLLIAMSEEAARLYGLAMDAYAEGNSALAGALDDLDDRLDQLHRDYIQGILEAHADAKDVQMAVQLALIGRYYERIGDHAVNIGERVQYMITGWLPEHTGAARAAARAGSDQHPEDDQGDPPRNGSGGAVGAPEPS